MLVVQEPRQPATGWRFFNETKITTEVMLTVADIRNKANAFPEDQPVEELLSELVVLYKIKCGLQEADEGKGLAMHEFTKEMEEWRKSL